MDKKLYPRIGEEVIWETLDNGLPVCIVPKQGFSRKYALFATRYGGMDMRFELKGQWLDTPAGIAHYLEHKMFDTKDGNALQELAKNGAEPNAFTSNAITCYYFDSTEKFYENLEILLSFVSVPYFTDESVEKEQGIIGQEIGMIEDNPEKVGTKAYGYEKAEEIAAAVAAKKEKESRQGGLDLATARKTPSYWLLWVGLAISSFPGVAFRFYNGAFFRGPIGLDTVTYSNWASVLSVCIAVGMILMGVMADKIGSVRMVVLMHVISIAGYACAIVLMKNTGSFALLLITVILCGMNGPLDNATAPYLIPEAFGRKYYDEIIGSYAGAMMIGNVCVPMLLGNIISDGTAASFGLAWEIIIGFSAVAMVILLVGLFRGPYRKQYLALKAEESQMKKSGAEV